MMPSSLLDPTTDHVVADAVGWINSMLLGKVATSISAICIAVIGLMALRGRIPVRHGVSVILGCFILFGAATIASGLQSMAQTGSLEAPAAVAAIAPEPPMPAPPNTRNASAYDPYAGASVPVQ